MRVIGLTGGVGGGKSTVTKLLKEHYGAEVIDSDSLGHVVMEPGAECYQAVIDLFGADIVQETGQIDRSILAPRVFASEEARLAMNKIIHPAVIRRIKHRIETIRRGGIIPYVVVETALMFESGLDQVCDEVWYVYADEKVRAERLAANRGYNAERIRSLFQSQDSDEVFRSASDVVIDNSFEEKNTFLQVEQQMNRMNSKRRG